MAGTKLIVGLGNPGKEYAHNRHNVGYRCVNHLARSHGVTLSERSCRAQFGIGRIAGSEVILAKPRTFMNLSGDSVSLLLRRFRVALEDVCIIHDDLDLPLGKIRFYVGGGSGGHKGVEAIVASLGTREFIRMRVGIGRPPQEMEAAQYVLTDFDPTEAATVEEVIHRAGDAIVCALREGLPAAMNKYN